MIFLIPAVTVLAEAALTGVTTGTILALTRKR